MLSNVEAEEVFTSLVFLKIMDGRGSHIDAGDDEAWMRVIEDDGEHMMLCETAIERYGIDRRTLP